MEYKDRDRLRHREKNRAFQQRVQFIFYLYYNLYFLLYLSENTFWSKRGNEQRDRKKECIDITPEYTN